MSILASRYSSYSSVTQQIPRAASRLPLQPLHDSLDYPKRCSASRSSYAPSRHRTAKGVGEVEKIFIQALVRAGRCSRHAQSTSTFYANNAMVQKSSWKAVAVQLAPQHRRYSTKSDNRSQIQAIGYTVTKPELKDLVDFYAIMPEDENVIKTSGFARGEDSILLTPEDDADADELAIRKTVRALRRLLKDEKSPLDDIWRVYCSLPHPSASHIPAKTLNNLLHRLSVVPLKTETSMLRYLTLVEDLRGLNFNLKVSAWTSAVGFVGRCLKAISSTQVDSALQLWRQMEHEAGAKSTHVTFTVLFDIATKSGKFVLAEMIMKEMERRNLEFNRQFRTGLIYHYGLRRDGNGVRKAYRELVDAGEIVDSAVITCVIKALLTCGEAVAAEQVFERTKRLHYRKVEEYEAALAASPAQQDSNNGQNSSAEDMPRAPAVTPSHWRAERMLGLALDKVARALRENPNPAHHRLIQDSVSLAPSHRTYASLVYYHAVTAGDLDRATELLYEIQDQGLTRGGQLYLYMFKGFSMHGGVAYTAWTRRRLEETWREYGAVIDAAGMGWVRGRSEENQEQFERLLQDPPEKPAIYMSLVASEYVLRAFARVAGYERTLQVWSEILARWGEPEIGVSAMHHIEQILARLFPVEFRQIRMDASVFDETSEQEDWEQRQKLEEVEE